MKGPGRGCVKGSFMTLPLMLFYVKKSFTIHLFCDNIYKAVGQRLFVNSWNASVAQWIEQCPPEACAAVRLRSDAYIFMKKESLIGILFSYV